MTSYVNPITGQTISPSQVGYEALSISANTVLEWPINGTLTTDVVAAIIEITATVASLNVSMPSAQQVGPGQSVLIRNTGANTFTVVDYSGNTIVSITSGIAQYIYLTDNSTDNGAWGTVTFGAGVSAANAATLAGYGLTAINTTLNQNYVDTTVYSDYAVPISDRAQFLVWTGGVGALTLPSAGTATNGWFIMVRNGGTGILTLTPSGADTIDGNATQQLQLTESLVIVSNGSTKWDTFAYGRSNVFAYTQLAKTVATGTYTLTPTEYANVIQEYFGALSGNVIVVLPSTVQVWYLNNQTSGSYTLTFKTAVGGAAAIIVPQGQTIAAICDGSNIYNANSTAVGSITSLTLGSGSVAAPSLNYTGDTGTGMYHPASGKVAWATGGVDLAVLDSTGLYVVNGISGGSI